MSVPAQIYTYGYFDSIVRQNKCEIKEIYIPSHKIIFNYEKYEKRLNVFYSELPRNYIQHSFKSTYSDAFLEEMKINEAYKEIYEKGMKNYTPPTITQLKNIEISLDLVKRLDDLSKLNETIIKMNDELTSSVISYFD